MEVGRGRRSTGEIPPSEQATTIPAITLKATTPTTPAVGVRIAPPRECMTLLERDPDAGKPRIRSRAATAGVPSRFGGKDASAHSQPNPIARGNGDLAQAPPRAVGSM